MATKYSRGPGDSPYLNNPSILPSATAQAAWAYFDPYKTTGAALWLESSTARFYQGAGASDAPSIFKWRERCKGRDFQAIYPARIRHPILVTDDSTSRPVMMFGALGSGSNILTNINNGSLLLPSILDGSGNETSNIDVFVPGQGISMAVKFRCAATSGGAATFNGATYAGSGTYVTGGAMIGGGGSLADSMEFSVDQSNGRITFTTRITSGSSGIGVVDYRDGAWHTAIVTFNPSTHAIKIWVDGTLLVNVTTGTVDFASTSGASKAVIGCFDQTAADGGNHRFGGALAGVFILPTDQLDSNSTARTAILNLMATL